MNTFAAQVSHPHEGSTLLTLSGSADMAHDGELSRTINAVAAARPARLVIDLSALDFLASLAIGQIVSLVRAVHAHDGRAAIACANPLILGALTRSNLQRLLPVLPSMFEAEQTLDAPAH